MFLLLWDQVLNQVAAKISKPSFDTWFTPTSLKHLDNHTFVIGSKNEFARDWLKSRYSHLIGEIVYEITGEYPTLIFEKQNEAEFIPTTINLEQTFSNFTVESHHRFAQTAAIAVSEAPGKAFNPLYIYGAENTGKTHLLHAIGNRIRNIYPHLKIYYTTAESFLTHHDHEIDVLLVDDLDMIAGHEQAQADFFDLFQTRHQNHKQIVIAAKQPPQAIPNLNRSLVNLLNWGLIVDIPQSKVKQSGPTEKQTETTDEKIHALRTELTALQDRVRQLENEKNG